MAAKNFWQPKLGSACVAWQSPVARYRVFQQPPLWFRTALLPPGFWDWPLFSLRLCGKIKESITSPLLVTALNTMMLIGCLVFTNIGTSCGNKASQQLFGEVIIWSWQKFLIWEKSKHVWLDGMLGSVKSFAVWSFLLLFMACDENWPFLFLYVYKNDAARYVAQNYSLSHLQVSPALKMWNSWPLMQKHVMNMWPKDQASAHMIHSLSDRWEVMV